MLALGVGSDEASSGEVEAGCAFGSLAKLGPGGPIVSSSCKSEHNGMVPVPH